MLYVIKCTSTGLRKIGSVSDFGQADVERRFRDLQTGSAAPLILEAESIGGEVDEREIHHSLRSKRVRGEWFAVSFEEVGELAAKMNVERADIRARGGYVQDIEWRKLARAWWSRISARGLEPLVAHDSYLTDDEIASKDSRADAPSTVLIAWSREWIREHCVRAHRFGRVPYHARLEYWRERRADDWQAGAFIAALVEEGYPVRRGRGPTPSIAASDVEFCGRFMRTPRSP